MTLIFTTMEQCGSTFAFTSGKGMKLNARADDPDAALALLKAEFMRVRRTDERLIVEMPDHVTHVEIPGPEPAAA